MTTVLSRDARFRRGGRRPGWGLLTTLLVLAIASSSALVFTNRVELLKLAVIMALWAAVVAAFGSVIYRRQSDLDQARARDQKLVYDLQLDREISARREYELTVESQLRRELASELRDQAADEVAALRAELSALRTNLEILFDADLGNRPALETDRTTVRAYSDWGYESDRESGPRASHPVTAVQPGDPSQTAENPIIDVPEVGVPASGGLSAGLRQTTAAGSPEYTGGYPETTAGYTESAAAHTGTPGTHAGGYRGAHRRIADDDAWSPPASADWPPRQERARRYAAPESRAAAEPPRADPWSPLSTPPSAAAGSSQGQAAADEGVWAPPGTPGSHWASDMAADTDDSATARRATELSGGAFDEPAPRPRHGRHSSTPEPVTPTVAGPEAPRHYRQDRWPTDERPPAETTGPDTPPTPPPPTFAAPHDAPAPSTARHRSPDPEAGTERPAGGESVADLLARLQAGSPGGRRRRRRAE